MQRLEETRGLLWNFLRQRLLRAADVEDVIQETWIRARRAWPRYKEQGKFRSWLLRIAYRECCRFQKQQMRQLELLPADEVETRTPSRQIQQNERVERIHQAIRELPAHEREAVWLRVVEEMPYEELSFVLRCPENTAMTRVRRGLQRLRVTLKEER